MVESLFERQGLLGQREREDQVGAMSLNPAAHQVERQHVCPRGVHGLFDTSRRGERRSSLEGMYYVGYG